MDRFIVTYHLYSVQQYCILKSNMDRFIEEIKHASWEYDSVLKSNMDRFIGMKVVLSITNAPNFKIQYG